MSVICVNGIVTRYVNYRENDRILSIFTVEQGRVDAKARGCRRQTSALLPAAQPFVYGEFELFSGKDKFTVNQCAIKETFFPIREDIKRYGVGASMLQLAQEAVQEGQPNEALFSLLYYALSYLAYGENAPEDVFACFLAKYLNAIGYRPSLTACARCGRDLRGDAKVYYSAPAGGAVCAACAAGAAEADKTALEAIRRMLLLTDEEIRRVRLPAPLRAAVLSLLIGQTRAALDYGARAVAFFEDVQ